MHSYKIHKTDYFGVFCMLKFIVHVYLYIGAGGFDIARFHVCLASCGSCGEDFIKFSYILLRMFLPLNQSLSQGHTTSI